MTLLDAQEISTPERQLPSAQSVLAESTGAAASKVGVAGARTRLAAEAPIPRKTPGGKFLEASNPEIGGRRGREEGREIDQENKCSDLEERCVLGAATRDTAKRDGLIGVGGSYTRLNFSRYLSLKQKLGAATRDTAKQDGLIVGGAYMRLNFSRYFIGAVQLFLACVRR